MDNTNSLRQFEHAVPQLLQDLQRLLSMSPEKTDELFALDTVDAIERLYLLALDDQLTLPFPRAHLERSIIAYLGAFLIREAGGEWALEDNPDDKDYGSPVVRGFADDNGIGFAPAGILGRLAVERTGGVLRKSVHFACNRKQELARIMAELESLPGAIK